MLRSPHHPPVPDWYARRGRPAPTALTHDRAWWSAPDRTGPRRRLAVLARRPRARRRRRSAGPVPAPAASSPRTPGAA